MNHQPLDRRRFIGVSAAASVAALGSAFMGLGKAGPSLTRPTPTLSPPAPAPTPSTAPGTRFLGDPGVGRIYYGASTLSDQMFAQLESTAGKNLTCRRNYFQQQNVAGLVRRVESDHSAGQMPIVSIKPPGPWGDVAAGSYDSWLTSLLTGCQRTGKPVFLCIHHEPENDAQSASPWRAQDWVAMQNRAISSAARLAPLVTITPILMDWTFETRGRDPNEWMVPNATVFGADVYNPWSPSDGLRWRSFADRAQAMQPWAGTRPIVIAEHGCRTDPAAPSMAGQWMFDAFTWCTQNNVVALSYFDSDRHSRFGSWVLDSVRTQAFVTNLHRAAVASP